MSENTEKKQYVNNKNMCSKGQKSGGLEKTFLVFISI